MNDKPNQISKPENSTEVKRIHIDYLLIGKIIALGTVLISIYSWVLISIDKSVEKKLSDPKILRQIAAESRPMIVFDSNESILADMGAGQFIKSISVTSSKAEDGKLPTTIIIDFSTHLPVAPILTPLNYGDGLTINSQRGKGYSWVYKLSYGIYMESPKIARSYRLEILR